jgi:tRNA (cytidine/uridine-2'-O-)-methyltransferase
MFSIILYEPEIPPNTGNIIRLCANTGSALHLIEPLGFVLDDKNLRRAGLDYHSLTNIHIHSDFASCLAHFADKRIFALSAKGKNLYTNPTFSKEDAFLFGPETRGLPKDVLEMFNDERILRLPQITAERSLNLSNTAAIMVYEAWRQLNFI